MKTTFSISVLIIVLLFRTASEAQNAFFLQDECGMISNSNYYTQNYSIGSHGAGFRLYHNDSLIYEMSDMFGGPQAREMKFWDDTTGLLVVQYGYWGVSILYGIRNDSVHYYYSTPGYYHDLFIASRHCYYFTSIEPTGGYDFVTRLSDFGPSKSIAYPLRSDTTVIDTVTGMTFCDSLFQLDYVAYLNSDTPHLVILFHIDTLIGIPENPAMEFTVYPNPALDHIHIAGSPKGETLMVRFFDTAGRLRKICTNMDKDPAYLDIRDLTEGVCFIEISTKHYKRYRKLIIQ